MPTIPVYAFVLWSQEAGENKLGLRKATRETILSIGGKILEETQQEVDTQELDGNGFVLSNEPDRQ
jgi:hypothetical protein